MRKDMKIKHSVSSPLYKVWGNFFRKKALCGKTFFRKIYWRMFYMGTNNIIMQGGKLMVKSFQRSSQIKFSSHWSWSELLIYYLTQQLEDWTRKTLLHTMSLALEISCKACLLFKKFFSGDLFFDLLIIGLF